MFLARVAGLADLTRAAAVAGHAGPARPADLAGLAGLVPAHETVRRPGAALRAVARLIIDDVPVEVRIEESAGRRHPVLELRGPRLKVALRDRAERLTVARAQRIEDAPV